MSSTKLALVVEADAALGRMLARVLERLAYRVHVAPTPEEATACALGLPGLDLLVVDLTREDPRCALLIGELADRWPDATMVVLTPPSGSFQHLHRVSNVRFLPKPFDPADLQRLVPQAFPASVSRRLLTAGG